MRASGQFLSPERQAALRPYEMAERPVIGYAEDYPDGLVTGLHSHPMAQVLYALTGVMKVETESSIFVIPPTTALLMPADCLHSISMDGSVAMRCLFLRKQVASFIGESTRVITVSPLLRELVLAACDEPLTQDVGGRGYLIMELALGEVQRSWSLPTSLLLPKDPRLSRIVNALRQDPGDARSLDDWSESCGASGRTLARLFLRETGLTFGQWRLQARLNLALALLVTDGNIPRVAARVGFKSQSAFGAAFREAFGLTPGDARTLEFRAPMPVRVFGMPNAADVGEEGSRTHCSNDRL